MKECDIFTGEGVKTHSDPSYIFQGGEDPQSTSPWILALGSVGHFGAKRNMGLKIPQKGLRQLLQGEMQQIHRHCHLVSVNFPVELSPSGHCLTSATLLVEFFDNNNYY